MSAPAAANGAALSLADDGAVSSGGGASALESFAAQLTEALAEARADMIAAKVPVAGHGRVNSAFELLEPRILRMCAATLELELGSLRASSAAELEAQRAALDEQRVAEVAEKVGAVEAERDGLVAAAEEAKAAAERAAMEAQAAQAQAAQAQARLTACISRPTRGACRRQEWGLLLLGGGRGAAQCQ